MYTKHDFLGKQVRTYLFATILGLFLAKFTAAIFFMVDDMRRLIQWLSGKLFFRNTEVATIADDGISRSVFLSWLGIAVGGSLFGTLIYGYSNKYNYKVKNVTLNFPNLPVPMAGIVAH